MFYHHNTDRKSTRLNSSHVSNSYAVFCLKKKYTAKPLEVRMGSGKGAPEGWVAVVKPGKILFEIDGVEEEVAREALRLASHKLLIKTKMVRREEIGGDSIEG